MNRQAISIGRVWGVPLRVDSSWVLAGALLTWMLAAVYLPTELVLPATTYWILSAVAAILLFASVLLHEMGHVLVARWLKMPVHAVTLFFFGDVAETAPEPPGGRAELLVACAGPSTNLGLAALFAALAAVSGQLPVLSILARYLMLINGSLALLNLIPGLPLDAGHIWRVIVRQLTASHRRATRSAGIVGRLVGLLFIVLGVWEVLTGNLIGLWLALTGWFLQRLAAAQLKQQELADSVGTYSPSDTTTRGYVQVPAETTLQEVVDRQLLNVGARAFLVERHSTPVGVLTWRHINAVPRTTWQTTTAAQAMTPFASESAPSQQEIAPQGIGSISTVVESRPPA